jgi:hypothetical protein
MVSMKEPGESADEEDDVDYGKLREAHGEICCRSGWLGLLGALRAQLLASQAALSMLRLRS